MGHYTGPKTRVNRRLGEMIFENNGTRKAFQRRDNSMPGMHARRSKLSDYGLAMLEKQKIKYYYGLSERQLRRLYAEAVRLPGNTGEHLLELCEMRMDNVIRRAGLTITRPQARQGVGHGHFVVNWKKCTVASRLLKPGDQVHVKSRPSIQKVYAEAMRQAETVAPAFLRVDLDRFAVTVERKPLPDEFSLKVNVGAVIELLSR